MGDAKARPILFSAPMVRALLDGRKTQTRRVVKPQPAHCVVPCGYTPTGWAAGDDGGGCTCRPVRCPYGAPGDLLWVRETCRAHELTTAEAEDQTDPFGLWKRQGLEEPPYGLDGVIYRADGTFREIENSPAASDAWSALNAYRGRRGATVPPIHMPRWASRLTLRITDVRVERLQEISEEDARWESIGLRTADDFDGDRMAMTNACARSRRGGFAMLWDHINGAGAWEVNPWVWAVSFEVIRRNVDDVLATTDAPRSEQG
jgi:hypothetical protein